MSSHPRRSVTEMLAPTDAGIARAAELLAAGELVAIPTETVYGLAADARDDHAVARIYQAKGRPRFNPLIAHFPDLEAAAAYAVITEDARRLATFLPGPLTLVLPLAPGSKVSPLVTAGNDSLAIRVPAHPVARQLLSAFGGPLAAPSANPSGKISPTRADHVLDGLAGRIAAVLDGGESPVGVESTILDLTEPGAPALLRPGGLAVEEIEAALGVRIAAGTQDSRSPKAPGQLTSHYAPDARLRMNADHPLPGEVWIGFGPDQAGAEINLSPGGDLVEAAAQLFHALRRADRMGRPIAVAPVPERGLGRAINDRLRRAAAPRD